MTTTIRTPRGKRLTPRQYLALVALRQGSRAGAPECVYHHFDCAGWHEGPCSNEIAIEAGVDEFAPAAEAPRG